MPFPGTDPQGPSEGRVRVLATGGGPQGGRPSPGAVTPQVLYQRSMQALSLLLQSFVSENRSMDEVCFLLQVRPGRVWRGRGLPGLPHPPTQVPWGLPPLRRALLGV